MTELDVKIQTVIISGSVTLAVLLINWLLKPLWEKYFHNYKLKSDHAYEQKKKIKETISKNKVPLIDSAESLNHRLWNFTKYIGEQWHYYDEGEDISNKYYPHSFTYRFLAFFAWARKTEKEMIYLDSTISDPDDLEFIKYLKLLPQLFWDAGMFKGKLYDNSKDTDHFYRDDFNKLLDSMIVADVVITYAEFLEKENSFDFYGKAYGYLSSIKKEKECLKWQAVQSFHFMLMSFLTKFGYDFQKTSNNDLKKVAESSPKNTVISNLEYVINKLHLDKSKEIRNAILQLK
jgi:hypothetical protein